MAKNTQQQLLQRNNHEKKNEKQFRRPVWMTHLHLPYVVHIMCWQLTRTIWKSSFNLSENVVSGQITHHTISYRKWYHNNALTSSTFPSINTRPKNYSSQQNQISCASLKNGFTHRSCFRYRFRFSHCE